MKINFNSLDKYSRYLHNFINKYKFIILSILVTTIFFTLLSPIREGLTNQYEYLAPDPSGNTSWSQDTINQFIIKYNTVNDLSGNNAMSNNDFQSGSMWLSNVSEEEANYYIQNGKWPYNQYVTNNLMPSLQKRWPNRLTYAVGIGLDEANQVPQPLSYQIYSGTKPAPQVSSAPAPSSNSAISHLGINHSSGSSKEKPTSKKISDSLGITV